MFSVIKRIKNQFVSALKFKFDEKVLKKDPTRMAAIGRGKQVHGFGIDNVILSNDTVLFFGFPFDMPGAVANSNGYIYINDSFMAMPVKIQEAFIAHEYCHTLQFRSGRVGEGDSPKLIDNIELEHEADLFAVNHGHDMIPALQLMLEILTNFGWTAALGDIHKRIARLEGVPIAQLRSVA